MTILGSIHKLVVAPDLTEFKLLLSREGRSESEDWLTSAEVGELSHRVGLFIVKHLTDTTQRSETQRGDMVSSHKIHSAPSRSRRRPVDSRGVPHREVNVPVWQHRDDAHGGFHFVPVGGEMCRVVGQAHPVPPACKLHTDPQKLSTDISPNMETGRRGYLQGVHVNLCFCYNHPQQMQIMNPPVNQEAS